MPCRVRATWECRRVGGPTPSRTTFGPATATATAGGVTVTATAKVTRLRDLWLRAGPSSPSRNAKAAYYVSECGCVTDLVPGSSWAPLAARPAMAGIGRLIHYRSRRGPLPSPCSHTGTVRAIPASAIVLIRSKRIMHLYPCPWRRSSSPAQARGAGRSSDADESSLRVRMRSKVSNLVDIPAMCPSRIAFLPSWRLACGTA